MSRLSASTIVVMKGLAITAGSKPNLLAMSGRVQPTNFAQIKVKARVMQMTRFTVTVTDAHGEHVHQLYLQKVHHRQ